MRRACTLSKPPSVTQRHRVTPRPASPLDLPPQTTHTSTCTLIPLLLTGSQGCPRLNVSTRLWWGCGGGCGVHTARGGGVGRGVRERLHLLLTSPSPAPNFLPPFFSILITLSLFNITPACWIDIAVGLWWWWCVCRWGGGVSTEIADRICASDSAHLLLRRHAGCEEENPVKPGT